MKPIVAPRNKHTLQQSRKIGSGLVLLAALGLAVFWFVTTPQFLPLSAIPAHQADVKNGEVLYNIGGCISCHKPDPKAAAQSPALPSGGAPLKTPIGTLYPPNLTPDPATGLGTWTDWEFVNAMQRGLGRDGRHLIPAFPYTSYAAMKVEDVLDIKAYLMTLAPVTSESRPADIPLAPLLRRGIGAWKIVAFSPAPWQPDPAASAAMNRGAYLVNGPGHCSECHTPRNIFMASNHSLFLAGGPHPEGIGKVPSLRDLIGRKRYKDQADLVTAFQNGEELGYEHMSSGGMGAVQSNLAKLPQADVEAIAAYILSLK
jgi:mono/diheme cytochrome c family protein